MSIDRPHPSGCDRYRIATVDGDNVLTRIADTSLDGLGLTLVTLFDEEMFDGDAVRVGILDRETRKWLVDPWKGTGLAHV